jgi:hypothetical protein
MSLPGNGTTKKIIYGIIASVFLFLSGMVLSNSNRITAMEVKVDALTKIADTTLAQAERNRIENREEHGIINNKLDAIAAQIRK